MPHFAVQAAIRRVDFLDDCKFGAMIAEGIA
jgi:hypothetical protein